MRNRRIEILVALFGVLGVSGLAFLSMKAANLGAVGGGDTYRLQARFDNIGGLKLRGSVRSAGVTVGRISNIELDGKTFQGVVTLELERNVQFPKDTTAKILTAGLLGDPYVDMVAGIAADRLLPGETVAQTQPAMVLENLIGQFLTGKADPTTGASVSQPGAAKSKP